ncbi:MAG: AAA family ATPase, partial [Jaaginema sp. PMC 1079.18]|nr:AAA family ATPase [Jaaginema sp. PMC 1079.18]
MLKKLILKNWKSFRYAELPIDSLTVLIGANASGKSNAIEALDFLRRTSLGENFNSILQQIRRNPNYLAWNNRKYFSLGVVVGDIEEETSFFYDLEIEINSNSRLSYL